MRLSFAALICLLLPLAVAATDAQPAQPAEGREIPYENLYAPLAAVRRADPQGIVSSSVRAESAVAGQMLPAGLQVELRVGSGRQPLRVAADGGIDLPVRSDWASAHALVWVSRPKDEVKIVEIFRMRVPATTKLTYGQLMESLPVIERIQQQSVQIGDLMASRPAGIELAYPPGSPQTGEVGSGSRTKTWNSDDEGHLKIPFDPTVPANTPVTLSAVPIALQPYEE